MDGGLRHNFVEQLAISAAFAASGRLRPADAWLDHFWSNKDGYGREIDRQLAGFHCRGMDVAAAVEYVRAHPILLPLMVRKRWWNRFFKPFAGLA
jgi:hypothetical protein